MLDAHRRIIYRPEIDGLRAISVLIVMLFHAGLHAFQGGFIGVDIFFVISGYLITSIVMDEIEKDRFSVGEFYFRRIKRILPALTLVIITSALYAWFLLLPNDMAEFADSIKSVATISSNYYFWKKSGYFDVASEFKPLLHTWSLAVEEQFYFLFPLLMLFIKKFKKAWLLKVSMLLTLASLVLSQALSLKGKSSAFFLIQSRCWEILIGACTALYLKENDPGSKIKSSTKTMLELLAIILISLSTVLFNEELPLPGLLSLIPTIGACLIIVFSHKESFLGKILSTKPLVLIGLISYSAYLWHQPIFAFARREFSNYSPYHGAVLIPMTLVLAYISWKFVEVPFRKLNNRRAAYAFGLASTIIIYCLGYFLSTQSSNLNRFSKEKRPLIQAATMNVREAQKTFDRGGCFIDFHQSYEDLIKKKCVSRTNRNIILFGDSYAAHHITGAREAFKNTDFLVQQWTATSCRAIDFPTNNKRCRDFYEYFTSELLPKLDASSIVVISSQWMNSFNKIGREQFEKSLGNLFNRLKKSKAKIIILGQSPTLPSNPFLYLLQHKRYNTPDEFMEPKDNTLINSLLAEFSSRFGKQFLNPTDLLCEMKRNKKECMIKSKGTYLYFDDGHLSAMGSSILWKKIGPLM